MEFTVCDGELFGWLSEMKPDGLCMSHNIEAKKTSGHVAPLQRSRPISEIESVLLADLVACWCHRACKL